MHLALIGCGRVTAYQKGNDRDFLELLFDVGLVPRMTTGWDSNWDEIHMI